jgi:hypothetical protein
LLEDAFKRFAAALRADPANPLARRRLEDVRERTMAVTYYYDTRQTDRLRAIYDEVRTGRVTLALTDLQDLYYGLLPAADEATRADLRRRAGLSARTPIVLSESGTPRLRLVEWRIERRPWEEYSTVAMWFDVIARPSINYRVWLHANPEPRLSVDNTAHEFVKADHDPAPPTSKWSIGHVYVDRQPIYAPAGEYDVVFGLWRRMEERLCLEGSATCEIRLGRHRLGGPLSGRPSSP